jgi:hypothetical protein
VRVTTEEETMRTQRIVLWLVVPTLAACGAGGGSEVVAVHSAAVRAGAGALAVGAYHVTVPPEVFGTTTPVSSSFVFAAFKNRQGGVSGRYHYRESVDGTTTNYGGVVTCMSIYDFDGASGNRAKIGARVDETDDPTTPVGSFIWWQSIDEAAPGKPDTTTLAGFGDAAANQAFCDSSRVPRFGPFAVDAGDLDVESF